MNCTSLSARYKTWAWDRSPPSGGTVDNDRGNLQRELWRPKASVQTSPPQCCEPGEEAPTGCMELISESGRTIVISGQSTITRHLSLKHLLQEPHSHRGYSALCTARSALSAVIILPNGQKFGDHPHVKQFIKAVFNTDPPKPRYTTTWDPNVITKMLKSWYPATKLNMLRLTKKIVMLILLITGQRWQILTALNMERMCIRPDYFIFEIRNSDIKQGRQNYKPEPIRLKAYPDKILRIVHYLKIYLERTLHVRQAEKQLLLTTTRPFGAASRDTVSWWVRAVM